MLSDPFTDLIHHFRDKRVPSEDGVHVLDSGELPLGKGTYHWHHFAIMHKYSDEGLGGI